MTIELTEEQHKALAGQTEEPKRVVDRQTGAAYVLVPAEDYERVREVLEREIPPEHAPESTEETCTGTASTPTDPLADLRISTGLSDLAEQFDSYRFGRRKA